MPQSPDFYCPACDVFDYEPHEHPKVIAPARRQALPLTLAVLSTAMMAATGPQPGDVLSPNPDRPRRTYARGCGSAGCRTLDRCLCDCKTCRRGCR